MRPPRATLLVAIALLLLGACSSGSDEAGEQSFVDQGDVGEDEPSRVTPEEAPSPTLMPTPSRLPKPPATAEPVAAPEGGSGTASGPRSKKVPSGSIDTALVYPSAGTYTYTQAGYEEFCQPGTCRREDLPGRQVATVSHGKRTQDRAVVVSEANVSNYRTMRTTVVYTRRAASITEVFSRFSYQGLEYSNTYRPQPPIQSLRFPLREGATWTGEWSAQTSGRYRISVVSFERVVAAGATRPAARIEAETTLRGEYEGVMNTIVWVDRSTGAILQSSGSIDIESAFGRYLSDFETKLRSGPGY